VGSSLRPHYMSAYMISQITEPQGGTRSRIHIRPSRFSHTSAVRAHSQNPKPQRFQIRYINPLEIHYLGVQVGPRDTLEADTLSYISLLPLHTNETFGFPRRDAAGFWLFDEMRHWPFLEAGDHGEGPCRGMCSSPDHREALLISS
jgi:hypothetical protein